MNTKCCLFQICLVGTILLPFAAQAQFTFTTNNDAITITGHSGNPTVLNIPSTTNGYPVVNIGDHAFQSRSSLLGVIIPDSVTNIGNYAFSYCGLTNFLFGANVISIGDYAFTGTKITNLVFPDHLVQIGAYAFQDCYSVSSIIIPNSVVSIGTGAFGCCDHATNILIGSGVTNIGMTAFWACTSLATISVNPANIAYSTEDNELFDKGQTTILFCPKNKPGDYFIPDSVVNIGTGSFAHLGRLTSVRIPNSVTNIGPSAFEGCGLTNIVWGTNVATIGNYAFYMCNLTKAFIPGRVMNLGAHAFGDCARLTSLFFLGNAPTNVARDALYYDLTTVYYLPATTGWEATFAGRPTALWNPQAQSSDGSFGVRTNQFGFNITGTTNIPIVVEASSNFSSAAWVELQSAHLTNGVFYFSDSQWTNYPNRFYRIRTP